MLKILISGSGRFVHISLISFMFFSASTVLAEVETEDTLRFNIPRLQADKALIQFAQQADVTLLYPYKEVKALRIGPLRGRFTVQAALEELLSDTSIGISAGLVNKNQESIDKMKKTHITNALLPAVISLAVIGSTNVISQSDLEEASPQIEEVTVLGSRAPGRSSQDLPVPVDVIGSSELSSVGGGADVTDILNALVPSYVATPATGDGSAFVRPTSLRGLASDQTLVLVNGSRRHRSALVQLFAPAANNGSHGVDVAMIPTIGLKNVEILRDGAAAQYGSDAIAGVINFQLKDDDEGGSVELRYGQHYEGESSAQLSANKGFSLGGNGFLNVSINTDDYEALSRGIQRQVAQDLIDAGVEGVGEDAVFGDAPFVQTWGRPETSGTRFVFNSGYDLNDDTELYAFGNFAKTEGRYRFFYRDPSNSDLAEALALGATNLAREEVAGYTPFLDGEQTDLAVSVGLRGLVFGETTYDLSISSGSSELDYTLFNSLNGDAALVGTEAVRTFNTGDYEQEEFNINADFGLQLSDNLFLAYGAEYRDETFTQLAGEEAAFIGGGVSGLAGTGPQDAGEFSRDNYAVYVDFENEISDSLLVQYALRYEDFSDFGSTLNGKVAGRYNISDGTALRGAISTGFHAPTPGQSNLRSTTTTFEVDPITNLPIQVDVGLLPADSPEVAALGGQALTEEEAVNISFGVATDIGDAGSLTVDAYFIQVDGRIYRTEIDDVSFYTNALDVEHSGLDVIYTQDFELSGIDSNLVFSYAYSDVDVTENRLINGSQVVSDDLVEDIENNYPNHKFTLTSNFNFSDDLTMMLRARYTGDHFDERGNIAGTSSNGASQEIDAVVYVDLELNYNLSDNWNIALGASNLFDEFPDEIPAEAGVANRVSVGLPFPRRSAANYEGGSWYLKTNYSF